MRAGLVVVAVLAVACQGADPYSVPVFTSERTERSLCAMVSTCDAIVLASGARLGTTGPVRFSSGTFTMTAVHFEKERALFGDAPATVTAYFHGGVGNGDYAPKDSAFVGDLSGVLAGGRGLWFVEMTENTALITGNGVFTEHEAETSFAATSLEQPIYTLAEILDEIALRGDTPRSNRGCSR